MLADSGAEAAWGFKRVIVEAFSGADRSQTSLPLCHPDTVRHLLLSMGGDLEVH